MSKRSVLFAGFLALTLSVGAQQTGSPPAPTGGTRGTGNQNTSPPASLPTTQPQTFPNSPPGVVFGRGPQPIMLAGKVELDDGSMPSEPIRIERYCSGTTVTEAHTDRKGRFSFQLGGDVLSVALDTSLQATPLPGNAASTTRGAGGETPWVFDGSGAAQKNLRGCVIRAALFGYRSDTVPLDQREYGQRPDVGVITLHRLEGVKGRSTSSTSLNAPKKARQRFEKGLQEIAKDPERRDLRKAGESLAKAVAAYPRYAAAWTALGKVRAAMGNLDGAQRAFQASIEADSDYMPPYQPLILLEMGQRRWQQVFNLSEKLLQLHEQLTHVRYYQAKASFFLGDLDKAESLSRLVLSSAEGEFLPDAHQLLGLVYSKKGQLKMAAAEYRKFVATRPNSDTAALLKKQLEVWEANELLAEQTAAR